MTLPLIISDADGRLLYKNRAVSTAGFLHAWNKLDAKTHREGIVFSGKFIFYVKKVSLRGKKYLFFMDYSKIGEKPYKLNDADYNGLFDFSTIAKEKREIPLSTLVGLFASSYMPELYNDGIRVVIHEIAVDTVVEVPCDAFVLALSLLARLSAEDGRVVKFSFVNDRGRVTVICDGEGSEKVFAEARTLLEVMLYEVSAAAGFSVSEIVRGGRKNYWLELSPIDISLLGLKVEPDDRVARISKVYAAMFL